MYPLAASDFCVAVLCTARVIDVGSLHTVRYMFFFTGSRYEFCRFMGLTIQSWGLRKKIE